MSESSFPTNSTGLPNPVQPSESRGTLELTIGVMGGAGEGIAAAYLRRAEELGAAVAVARCILITGGCPGLPLAAAKGAKTHGGYVVGISPGLSLEEHAFKYESPTIHHECCAAELASFMPFTWSGFLDVPGTPAPLR